MSSLATVNVNNLKSAKYGSTEVKKIMRGSDRLWPLFPIVLKLGDTFYNVTGIQNDRYVKTEVPKIRCYLAKVYSSFETGLYQDFWLSVEACISSFKNSHVAMAQGGGDTNKDFECFQNGSTLYFDYMATYSNGTSFNRLNLSVSNSPYNQIYDTTNLNNKWILEYTTDETLQKKYIKLKRFGETSYLLTTNKTCYTPNVSNNRVIQVPNPDNGYFINMYYVKIYDRNHNLISFCHMKDNNGQCVMYDEIQNKFLNFSSQRTTSGNLIYDDKYVDMDPVITEYFEWTSYEAIPNSNEAYGTITNNKTGLTMSGVLIDKSIEVDNGEYADDQTIDGINYKLYGFGVDDGLTSSNITIKGYTKFSLYMDLTLIGYGHDIFTLNNQEYSIYDLTQTQDDFGSIIYYIGEFTNINPIVGTTLNIMADGPIVLYISA